MTEPSTTIFIIDDNADFRGLCSQALKLMGYQNQTFSRADVALEALVEACELPRLIFVDMNMPEMSGGEFIREVRANERLKDLHIVLTSGWEDVDSKAQRLGANAFLKKPFELDEFYSFLENQL